jgi:hypothetical protein
MPAMQQILPGIYYWTGPGGDDGGTAPAHSYYIEPAGALIDAVMPEEGPEAFTDLVTPQQVILTNHRHFRDSDSFAEAFGCLIRAAAPAMPLLEGRGVKPFWFGDEVAYGITAVEIGRVCDEETALHVAHGNAAIAFGDGLVHPDGATVAFASDDLLGRHPDRVKRGLKDAFRGLLVRDFDALLFAHGEPLRNDGKAALRRFVEEPTEYEDFGPYA